MSMAHRARLTQEALIALGADRLAKLVFDEVGRSAPFKKIVTAALAGAKGPDAVAAIIDRRLASLERARGYVDWEKRKAFAADLKATLATITNELGNADPASAVDRIVRFLANAERVFERVDDSSGYIQSIFHEGATALPGLAEQMSDGDRVSLFDRLLPLLLADGYGLIETVVHDTIRLIPPPELARIEGALTAALQEIGPVAGDTTRDWERRSRRDRLIRTRQVIADRSEDVDAFIALEQERSGGLQDTIGIAERLLTAGRLPEALDWVRRSGRPGVRKMDWQDLGDATHGSDVHDGQRVRLEIRILAELGEHAAAQDLRWQTFEATLEGEILRDYLQHLPDFEDFEALERAFAHAAAHPHRYRSLAFFLSWPRLDLAEKLVIEHRATWGGQHYGALVPAAELLEHDHPEAATVLYRALIDDILGRARSPAYGHAARYLTKLDLLSTADLARRGLPDHSAYLASLRRAHGRKTAFWSLVD
jgi:hypothetical protein